MSEKNENLSDGEKITNILEKFEEFRLKNEEEVQNLKKEISSFQERIEKLEKDNKKLILEKNRRLVKENSNELIECCNTKNFHKFKKIIKENEFPIDEYLSETEVSQTTNLKYNLSYISYSMKNSIYFF